jgi:hypothetical protein
MPGKKHDISAVDFKDPLIKVLYQLSEGTETPVFHEKTYSLIFQLMGITRDQYGMEKSSSNPLTERWVQFCVNGLITEDLIIREKKGYWALTKKGLEEARKLITVSTPQTTTITEKEETDFQDQSIIVGPNTLENAYHTDSYLRYVAASESECLGKRSSRSPICKTCALVGACLKHQAVILNLLATELSIEDQNQDKISTVSAEVISEVVQKTDSRKLTIPKDAKTRTIPVAAEVLCPYCSVQISIGAPAIWVQSQSSGGFILHPECYKKLKEA